MTTDSSKKPNIIIRVLRFFWRSLKALNTIVFGLIALFIIVAVLAALANKGDQAIPEGVALLINPEGALVEQKTVADATALLQGGQPPQQTLVKDVLDALALAKDDSRIGLVVLQLDSLDYGILPKLERISAAIADFKTSGKKVIAIGENYSQSALFLAAHADEVLLNPEGMALPMGFSMNNMYFKSFLEKHDVTVNLFKVGKYKSAVDPYLRDDMSEEDRAARTGILEPWWKAYTDGVETARGLDKGSIHTMLENSSDNIRSVDGNLARLSLDAGLADRLVTNTELRSYLVELAGEDSETMDYRSVSYNKYLRIARKTIEQKDAKVAVITAVGNIVNGDAPAGSIGDKSLSKLIRSARLDSNVKAIVLRIDSGGGSKTASEIIRSELEAAQDAGIPVIASMGSVAASGGYWIAASADEIWATPTTVTGSIGIFGLMPSFEKTLANYGIFSDGVATTPVAGGASITGGITPAFAEGLQLTIESGYQQFLTTVAEGRDMEVDAVHEVAQGRIWTGEKAKEIGLVDELGDLEQAITAAARLADIDDYSVWHVKKQLSVEEQLMLKFAEMVSIGSLTSSNNPISRVTNTIRKELSFLETLNDPSHAYVICSNCPVLD